MNFMKAFYQANGNTRAIVDKNGERITLYAELNAISGKVASKLQQLGLEKDDVVVVKIGRQMEYIAAELGCMKLGLVFVPVLPTYPDERIEYIKNDSNAKLILDENFFSDIDSYTSFEGEYKQDDADRVMVIYTSGSTGRPKGVLYRADAFNASVLRLANVFDDYKAPIFGASAPLSFVASLMEYYAAFSLGGCTHILADDVRSNITEIENYYEKHSLTHGFLSPRVLKLYHNKDKALVAVFTGSERLSDVYTSEYIAKNLYGQSEGMLFTSFKVNKKYKNTPIGFAVEGVTITLGEEGEICAKGVFPYEYLNRPEESAKTFEKCPDGEVTVHTGDIGTFLPDGNLLYLNRRDWMVKINGQRVEPGEVEATLKAIDGIQNATVKDFSSANGQTYLCGYYVAEAVISDATLKKELLAKLPDYMIPAYFMKLDKIPVNVNGKLDRTALPSPKIESQREEYAAPENETEEALCTTFEKILTCENVGRNDDFFYLGGDSIKVMELQNVCSIVGLTTNVIFKGRTPAGIAAKLVVGEDLLDMAMAETRERYPLTASQYGVYFECLQNPTGTMYNIPFTFSVDKNIGIEKLTDAIQKALCNHPALHAHIVTQNGEPFLEPAEPSVEISVFSVTDIKLYSILADFVKPFDIEKCLYRTAVFETESSYTIAIDCHHLVFDGTSMSILCRDISLAFDGCELEGEQMSQFGLGIYEDLFTETEDYNKAKAYYDKIWSGVDCATSFIRDEVDDVNVIDKPATTLSFKTSGNITFAEVEAFANKCDVTVNSLLTAAYEYTFLKFAGENEGVICTANHGRHDSRLQNTVGMMVRTVPLYFRLDEEQTIFNFVRLAHKDIGDGISNDCYPFMEIAKEYGVSSEYMFVYQADNFTSITLDGKKISVDALPLPSAQSNMTLMAFKEENSFCFDFIYRSDIFDESIIRSFADSYMTVLSVFMSVERLCDVTLTSEAATLKIDSFNETAVEYDTSKSIVDLFRERVEKNPDSTAVVFGEKSLTYKEVDEISENIAGYLRSFGIGHEDVVSVLIPRCEYMVTASIGALKSGAGYQPLDPSYPTERLEFMIEDSSAKILIADESLLSLVPNYKGKVLLLKDISALPKAKKIADGPKPENLFIMLYTSGTTGKPKGVMLEHRNLVNFCNYYIKKYELNEESHVTAYASYGFDASMMDTYPTLLAGGEIHILPEEIRLDLVAINAYFESNTITHAFLTTQVFRAFIESMDNHSLKFIAGGGEALVPIAPPENYDMYNFYGPSECTIFVTAHKVDRLNLRVPIGKAVNNTKLYIADKYGRRMPVGAPGELCVAGHAVGRGYLNRPEMTAFCGNPYSNEAGYERMYHTGDIVRFLDDGSVDYIGRRDGQVKIRGFRIELSEVEKIIREFKGIKNATVIARDAAIGGKEIVAYIVADEEISIDELNSFIMESKPSYMVPAATMQIDKIPLNVNGKVDKRKLPVIEVKADAQDTARPMNILEEKIAEIVAKIIGSENFGVTSVLQRYGLASLSVIKMAVEIKNAFGVELDVKEMMKECSVLSIENAIIKHLIEKPDGISEEQKEIIRKASYTLSKTQLGVYADSMKEKGNTSYNIPMLYVFPMSFDAEKLADSVKKVILAHPYVFTHLVSGETDIEQVYTKGEDFRISTQKMSEAEFKDYKKGFVMPFNLTRAPLFRIEIVSTEEHIYLLCDFHHIIFDGASVDIFAKQIGTVYEGGEVALEANTYFDYVENEIRDLKGEKYTTAENFFGEMLKECEGASEITPELKGDADNGQLSEVCVKTNFVDVHTYCKENGVTAAHTYLAALFYAVSRFTNSRNVYVSTISNGRTDLKFSDTFGMFVKTIPLGISISDISVKEFIEKSKDVFVGAIENELYPYSVVCNNYSYAPHIMYEYQLGVTEQLVVCGEEIQMLPLELRKSKFKVAVHIEERNGEPAVVVQYNDALYSAEYMRTVAESIEITVNAMVNSPTMPVRKISMLNAHDKAKLEEFAHTELCPSSEVLMHGAFEKIAKETPEKIALVASDKTLSYGELDSLGNVVANALIAKGLQGGDRVILLLERTSRFICSLFGVLKAGGAYIPSSLEYPDERINEISEDSNAKFIITESEYAGKFENCIDVNELLKGADTQKPQVEIKPEDTAYMIYTSGSTGKPKGVILHHRGIANYITNAPQNPQVSILKERATCYGSVTTVTFDMWLKESFIALSNGLTYAFASDEASNNPKLLAEFMLANHVDVFNATPSRLLQYLELDEFRDAIMNCKVILSGGEKYPEVLLDTLRNETDATILNTYGPTEITVSSNAAILNNAERISIGRPLLNYIEYIVDEDDNLLPIGVVGELIICGVGVADGYNNLPEQTAKAFIEFNGMRAYRSGDYARWLPTGEVEVLGRKDNQVKLRGLRIELGEIEKTMSEITQVKRAVVVIKKLGNADALCAYFTAERSFDADELKRVLAEKLTDYMIPSSFTQLEELPLSVNGKVNYKALPEPTVGKREAGKPPTSEGEKIFCEIFSNVLELETVYADDNFFELGGSSLTVTRIVILANKKDIDITFADVFDNPTPSSLAALVNKGAPSAEGKIIVDYDYTDVNAVLAKNTLESFKNGTARELGTVMITGALGYLGIHILYELLKTSESKIYCLLRSKGDFSSKARLNSQFFYYFDSMLGEDYPGRIEVVECDINDRETILKQATLPLDTVINCAANVKHFAAGSEISDVNYLAVQNLIELCKSTGARFIQTSTMSVGGAYVGKLGEFSVLKENQLYIGQSQLSKYTESKFMAERLILSEVAKGLDAKIMRLGNLAPRESDGEFQMNMYTNGFMGRLKANVIIAKYPYSAIEGTYEMSPIDYVAKAIVLLSQTSKDCTVFHPFNNHTMMIGDLYDMMNKMGLHSEVVEPQEYVEALEMAKSNTETAAKLSGLLAYDNMGHGQKTYAVGKNNDLTMQVLYRMGFKWPTTTEEYEAKFINALHTLNFFDE